MPVGADVVHLVAASRRDGYRADTRTDPVGEAVVGGAGADPAAGEVELVPGGDGAHRFHTPGVRGPVVDLRGEGVLVSHKDLQDVERYT